MSFLIRLLFLSLPVWALAAPLDRIVAIANNDVITRLELDARIKQVSAQLKRQGTPPPEAAQLERQVLERMLMERLQLQNARELGIQIEDSEVDRAVQRIADNNKLTLAELRRAVLADGVSWERFRTDIRTEMLLGRLRDREVEARVSIGEAEVDALLASQAGQSKREYQLAHILLRAPEGVTPAQLARLRARADEVMAGVKRGEDFGRLAAAFSDAPDAMQGGLLEWRSAERLPVLFTEGLTRMKPGETSEVLRSPAGFHIFKFVAQRDAGAQTLTEMQTRARHILIRTADGTPDAEAQRRLNDIRQRVLAGADFGELARANSSDLSSSKGGDLGWLAPGETVPEFEGPMDALKPGELSQPIRSPFGWHLIQVQERRTVDVTDRTRRAEARAALRERKGDELYDDWLRSLRDRAYVEIRLDQP